MADGAQHPTAPPTMPSTTPPTMPQGLRRLWGVDEGSRPGQRPSLDIHQVARAAIALADEGGLEAVSMGRVAASLGVTTMALYRYVESKAELLELMLEVGAGEPPPIAPGLDWRAAITAWAENLAATYRRHPWSLHVPVFAPPRGPYQLAWAEQGMQALSGTELNGEERLDAVMLLLLFLRGQASLEEQIGGSDEDGDFEAAFVGIIAQLDADRFPNLTGLLNEPPAEADPSGADVGITPFGLERILDGIELLVRRRRSAARNADGAG